MKHLINKSNYNKILITRSTIIKPITQNEITQKYISWLNDSETNKLNISIKLNKILEEMILRDPGQWIWTHNRWK